MINEDTCMWNIGINVHMLNNETFDNVDFPNQRIYGEDWLIDRLIDWLMFYWSIDRFIDRFIDWLMVFYAASLSGIQINP